MLFEEIKYAKIWGSSISGWKVVHNNPFLANFRCPICGDSQMHKEKRRGYIYTRNDTLCFYCHNCNSSRSFRSLLKKLSPEFYRDFLTEEFSSTGRILVDPEPEKIPAPVDMSRFLSFGWRDGLKRISKLDYKNIARYYLESRGIPEKFFSHFFYAEKYPEWRRKNFNEDVGVKFDDPRIVIPIEYNGEFCGAIARALNPKSTRRYINSFHEGCPKLWINPFADLSRKFFVFEGVFDACFVDQSCALLGTSGSSSLIANRDYAMVLDSDSRNEQVAKQLWRYIVNGESVVIWDNPVEAGKDINEMIKSGFLTTDTVVDYFMEHTHQGLDAELNFSVWNKSSFRPFNSFNRRQKHGC